MKKLPVVFFAVILRSTALFSQDEVLLKINDQPVLLSEFERIYHKNSNIEGYENKPPAEYLEMFINFKLKVLEAQKLGYDTVSSFLNELAGYREQLSKPYLQDRNLIDKLVKEAYDRTVTEVNASHIMAKLPSNPSPADTVAAYNKALSFRNRLLGGESFEKLARTESEDPSAKVNGGLLGWFSAFTMVYSFEDAAYNNKAGEYSMPVRSRYGYHIIRTNAFRPALGEVKLAHIMVRTSRNEDHTLVAEKKEKIDSCHKLLKAGNSFAEMVKQFSEDAASARNNGMMRWIRSGELPAELEESVFALTDSGTFTEPIRSEFGWHIFQLQGKRPVAPFEQLKSQLEERVMMDDRGKRTEETFVNDLKKQYQFKSYPDNLNDLVEKMDSSLYSGNWDPNIAGELIEPVFSIDGKEYSQKELADFIVRTRRYNRKDPYIDIVDRKFKEMIFNELLSFEKKQLDEKYPAFRHLMEEYHDGILLFNIMDDKVWSRAVNDSAGLMKYYNDHSDLYFWGERADVSLYTFSDPALTKSVLKLAKKRSISKIASGDFIKTICSQDTVPCIDIKDQKYEKQDELPDGGFTWKKGFSKTVKEGDKTTVLVVNDILPPSQKAFTETQGQVTADYQNYLDSQWIESLRAKYTVTVDRTVLQRVK
ncbi:MAG TPA: peptidylprolyl isomerase [Bacteroidales bacterium]|jgi:peptidyl-prolyl cis-trans isomerase SurA|nr:peptidylprolyl isomerase [Bacteroidales bacterium]